MPTGKVRPIAARLRALEAPEPLRALPGWLMWRYETHSQDPKPRKVPYYTTGVRRHGHQGGPHDRANLTGFAAARDAAARMGFDGVGLAMLADWGVVAIDVDHCVSPAGDLPPEIEALVSLTYAEYSPSGAGLRAFFTGNLGNRKSHATAEQYGFETFTSTGFVTFTGNILPHVDVLGYEDRVAPVPEALSELCQQRFGSTSTSTFDPDDFMAGREPRLGLTVEDMQALLDQLDPDMGRDPWLRVGLALHHETEGDDTGLDLWDGWSGGGASYPGHEGLLYQWESFKGPTPGRRQITMASVIKMAKEARTERPSIATAEQLVAAVAGTQAGTQAGRTPPEHDGKFAILQAAEAMQRPPIDWFIKGVLPRGELGILFGASGSGKTFVALDLAMAVARGVDWHGNRVGQPQRVLYIAAEGSGGLGRRIRAYCRHHNIDPDDVLLSVMYAAPNFMDRDDITEVLRAITSAGGFDLIVVDTFAQVTPGANENAGEDMGRALANTRALREASGAMPFLVHHAGKDASKGSRGWSGLKAAADVQVEILRHEGGLREMHLEKLKDGEDGRRWTFALEIVEMGLDDDGDLITSCVVVEAQRPQADVGAHGSRRRGRVETHILEMMTLYGTADTVKLQALVDAATAALPQPGPGERDTRRQRVTRAIQTLGREKDGPLRVEGGVVIFYE